MTVKIFYTASFYGKDRYQPYYDKVLEAINICNVDLISPEVGGYDLILTKSEKTKIGDPLLIHYEAIRKGIMLCDAAIIEASNEDFQLGHEATIAVESKKHVLCLSVHQDFSKKIKNPFFHGAKYNMFNIEQIVKDFVNELHNQSLSERFNFFLSPRQLTYLEQTSANLMFNKSEYLRRLIDEDMKKGISQQED